MDADEQDCDLLGDCGLEGGWLDDNLQDDNLLDCDGDRLDEDRLGDGTSVSGTLSDRGPRPGPSPVVSYTQESATLQSRPRHRADSEDFTEPDAQMTDASVQPFIQSFIAGSRLSTALVTPPSPPPPAPPAPLSPPAPPAPPSPKLPLSPSSYVRRSDPSDAQRPTAPTSTDPALGSHELQAMDVSGQEINAFALFLQQIAEQEAVGEVDVREVFPQSTASTSKERARALQEPQVTDASGLRSDAFAVFPQQVAELDAVLSLCIAPAAVQSAAPTRELRLSHISSTGVVR